LIKSLVISRSGDTLRRTRFERLAPVFLDWSYLEATDGHRPEGIPRRYSRLIPDLFWGETKIKPGAFGCFISHYRAWEQCLSINRQTIVFEDDVVFNEGWGVEDLSTLVSQASQMSFDVVFMNRRAVTWYRLHADQKGLTLSDIYPIREATEGIVNADLMPIGTQAPGETVISLRLLAPRG
jgi:GR25 family glycosyltransferase involved in LPS biosynthesis